MTSGKRSYAAKLHSLFHSEVLIMIIVNGQTKSLVIFGEVTPNDFEKFMAQMAYAISLHHGGDPA